MRERIDRLIVQIKGFGDKLDKKSRTLLMGVAGAVLIMAVVGAVVLNAQPYDIMFAKVNPKEAADIVGALQDLDVTAKYDTEGNISVPKKQVDEMRAKMVMMGYPKSGLTYTTYSSNVDMLTTDDEKNTYMKFELQDRLAGTICLFDGVEEAVVNVAVGQNQEFVLDKDKVEPSASVVVITDGRSLDSDQVRGIQRLVARGVPGMKEDAVLITDGTGRDLTMAGDNTQTGSAKLRLALEHDMENAVQANVLKLLKPIFGEDSVLVTAKCVMDVDKRIKEIITYLPTTEDNKGVMQHEGTGVEIVGQGEASAGVVGTDTNAQVPQYPNITTDGSDIYYKDDKSFDYLVSQMKEQIESDAGVLKDLTVSVVVDKDDMSREEMDKLKSLVAVTAGISTADAPEKVAVFKASFKKKADVAKNAGFFQTLLAGTNLLFIVIPLVLALLIFLAVGFVLRKRGKKKKKKDVPELPEQEPVAAIRLEDIKQTREQELKEEIRDFTDRNPEISAQLIKTWLRGGEH